MKRHTMPSILLAALLTVSLAGFATLAGAKGESSAKSASKGATTEWLVESPHSADQCLAVLDAISSKGGDKALAAWQFGCMSGEHVGWMVVRAPDEQTALQSVPEMIRGQAKAHKLNKFTAAELKALHEKMK